MTLKRTILKIFSVVYFIQGLLGQILKQPKSYDGFSLITMTPSADEHVDFALSINANSSTGMELWVTPGDVNSTAHVMVPSEHRTSFLEELTTRSIPFEHLSYDIGKIIREQEEKRAVRAEGFFEQYQSLKKINEFIIEIACEHGRIAFLSEVGKSTEGNSIFMIKLSTPGDYPKPAIWIQGGAHSNEYIGIATVTYLVNQLVTEYSRSEETKQLVEAFDWYILPVINPDGYEYAFHWDRLWRKTRSFNLLQPQCFGVDINRNWGFHWNERTGSSDDPCSILFAGPEPFSEPEARAISNYMLTLSGRLLLFMDFHSYSQLWLTAWGYTKELPPDYEEQLKLAQIATRALESVHGTKYRTGSSGRIFNIVSGGARDWAYAVAGARYSYTVELRDTGKFGFLLPDSEIIPTGEETWAGVKAMATALAQQIRTP